MTVNEASQILEQNLQQLELPIETKAVKIVNDKLKGIIKEYISGLDNLRNEDEPLCLGIVGQMKAGKSSFLNTWLFDGDSVLPIAATPMTAGLTTLEYTSGPNRLEICYYSKEDWTNIKVEADAYNDLRMSLLLDKPELVGRENAIEREMERMTTDAQRASYYLVNSLTPEAGNKIGTEPLELPFDNISVLQNILKDCVGANGKYTSVVSILKIYLNDSRLEGIRVVDTPGVNDPVVSREVRTHQFLHKCHGVFMLSRAGHFLGADDINFMDRRLSSVGVNRILVIGSQFDTEVTNPQYKGLSLVEAISKAQSELKKSYNNSIQRLQAGTAKAICGCVFSSGMAQAVLYRLKKSDFDAVTSNLDRFEVTFWENLTSYYPEILNSSESIEQALTILADFDSINNIVQSQYRSRLKEIKIEKRRNYLNQLVKVISEAATNSSKSLQYEVDYLQSADLNSLKEQIKELKLGLHTIVEPLQGIIDANAAEFQNRWANVEEDDLAKRGTKVECNSVSKTSDTISYTRKTTFWGRTKNGVVSVDIINRESTKEAQRSAMEKYRQVVKDKWKVVFNNFHDTLLGQLTEKLSALNAIPVECSMIITQIVKKTFDVELAKYQVLRLNETFSLHVGKISGFIEESGHTSFDKTFGEMLESSADENIKKQADEKLNNIRSGLNVRDEAYMAAMKNVAFSSIKKIAGEEGVLSHMRDNIAEKLTKGIETVRKEKEAQLNNKEKTLKELKDGIQRLNTIKLQLNG